MQRLAAHFEETDTNAGGIYYTEVEAVYDAQRMMRGDRADRLARPLTGAVVND